MTDALPISIAPAAPRTAALSPQTDSRGADKKGFADFLADAEGSAKSAAAAPAAPANNGRQGGKELPTSGKSSAQDTGGAPAKVAPKAAAMKRGKPAEKAHSADKLEGVAENIKDFKPAVASTTKKSATKTHDDVVTKVGAQLEIAVVSVAPVPIVPIPDTPPDVELANVTAKLTADTGDAIVTNPSTEKVTEKVTEEVIVVADQHVASESSTTVSQLAELIAETPSSVAPEIISPEQFSVIREAVMRARGIEGNVVAPQPKAVVRESQPVSHGESIAMAAFAASSPANLVSAHTAIASAIARDVKTSTLPLAKATPAALFTMPALDGDKVALPPNAIAGMGEKTTLTHIDIAKQTKGDFASMLQNNVVADGADMAVVAESLKSAPQDLESADVTIQANTATTLPTGAAALLGVQIPRNDMQTAKTDVPQTTMNAHMSSPNWGEELGGSVHWMVDNNHTQARIHLNPAELGPIEVVLTMRDQEAGIQFAAHHAATREAVEAAVPRLREMLADAGIQLNSVNVSDQSSQQQNTASFNQQASSQRDSGQEHDVAIVDDASLLATPNRDEVATVRRGILDAYA